MGAPVPQGELGIFLRGGGWRCVLIIVPSRPRVAITVDVDVLLIVAVAVFIKIMIVLGCIAAGIGQWCYFL